MKIGRRKRTQRTLVFYANTFGFREPYQVLVDGTFCQQALVNKVNVSEQLPKLLEGRVELVTTSCAVVETESLLPATFGASLILKKFPARKCGHKSAKGGAECFASMVKNGNEHRYFVATQDSVLQEKVRSKPPVPIIFLHGATPTLEKPSPKCEELASAKVHEKTRIAVHEVKGLETFREILGLPTSKTNKKKKKLKGPNPLSCKKPRKPKQEAAPEAGKVAKKRHRKRIKLPKHVKEELRKAESQP